MADGKRVATFDVVAHFKAWLLSSITGKPVNVWEMNPYRTGGGIVAPKAKPVEKTPEQIEHENDLAWSVLDQFFQG